MALAKREEARRTLSTSSRDLAAVRAISRTTMRQVTTSNDGTPFYKKRLAMLRRHLLRCVPSLSLSTNVCLLCHPSTYVCVSI